METDVAEGAGAWRERARGWAQSDRLWFMALALCALVVYGLTVQIHVNGSRSPYATDVGEIQNALPRWGTLHFTGYPQYSLLGSLFVALLRAIGISPALASGLFSAVWAAINTGLTFLVARRLDAPKAGAALAAVVSALTLSMWMDASLAEVHTMTMALSIGAMLAALRFRASGRQHDLLWLVALLAHGIVHQRAVFFLGPAIAILVLGRWRAIMAATVPILLHGVGALATYLYLPVRAWMGADWTFNAPGTWQGFWGLVFDTKSERIVRAPSGPGELLQRSRTIAGLLQGDLPWLLLLTGLVGLALLLRRRRAPAIALLTIVAVHVGVSIIIWEGRVSDALLAIKLPAVWACVLGLAFVMPRGTVRWTAPVTAALTLLLAVWLGVRHAPQVWAVTRDDTYRDVVQRVSAIAPPDEPTTVWVPWGHDYWALRYVQTYEASLDGLRIADHNVSLEEVLATGERLVTPQETFYVFAPDWFRARMGGLALSAPSAGLVTLRPTATLVSLPPDAQPLGNGLAVSAAQIERQSTDRLQVRVTWLALQQPTEDYAVGVHLIGAPSVGEAPALLSQADSQHPVYGWYPTTQWAASECVDDVYSLPVPAGAVPAEVLLFMYTHDETGFHNSQQVRLAIP